MQITQKLLEGREAEVGGVLPKGLWSAPRSVGVACHCHCHSRCMDFDD